MHIPQQRARFGEVDRGMGNGVSFEDDGCILASKPVGRVTVSVRGEGCLPGGRLWWAPSALRRPKRGWPGGRNAINP